MSFPKRIYSSVFVSVATLTLAGCIGTEIPLIGEYGDRVAFGDKMICSEAENPVSRTIYHILEVRSDESPSKFKYVFTYYESPTSWFSMSPITAVFQETQDPGVYLVETGPQEGETGTYYHFWFDENYWTGRVYTDETDEEVRTAGTNQGVNVGEYIGSPIAGNPSELKAFFAELAPLDGGHKFLCTVI